MSDKIQIVIVDDHPLFRDGVVNTLKAEPDFEIVGEGATAEEAVRLTLELLPDLLLLDLSIPGGGLKAAQAITSRAPVTKIIVLTASESEDDLMDALKVGARAYILKGVAARELVRIVRATFAGEAYVTPGLAASLLFELTGKSSATRAPANPLDELSQREHEILELVAAGKSNKEIGYQLHLAEKTVKHHMTNILQKLQVRNRVEAALLAVRGERVDR
ncbi:MAG: response regulator transcription factor [Anaerolineae bacterium]